MANTTVIRSDGSNLVPQKAVDRGDGSYALEMANVPVEAFAAELREPVTAGARVITTDHASIHQSWGFSAYVTFDAVADAATRNIVFTAPAAEADRPYAHLKFYDVWINNAAGLLQLYEAPYSVADGTPITPVNRNRSGTPEETAATLVHTATVTLDNVDPAHTATLLETLRFGGGGTGPQGRVGGDRSLDIEWVLAPGEEYVFVITNQSGGAANIGVWLFWYEEPAGSGS